MFADILVVPWRLIISLADKSWTNNSQQSLFDVLEPFSSDDLLSGETGDLGGCQVLARVILMELSVLLAPPAPVCHIKQNKHNKTFPGLSPLTRSDNTLAHHVIMLLSPLPAPATWYDLVDKIPVNINY